jgi:hypothetical protein
MDSFARYALFACIVASAAGGVVISMVAFRYGLTPLSGDDPAPLSHRRLFITHLGHAFAAVAFAATVVLAAAAMVSADAASERQSRDVAVLTRRLDELDVLVRQMTEAFEQAVKRFDDRGATRNTR